jgi:uncharacterized membrane protein YtjA (UPF0391 family)
MTLLEGKPTMIRFAVVVLIIALVAVFMGFGGMAALTWEGARTIFIVCLILAVLTHLAPALRARSSWRF